MQSTMMDGDLTITDILRRGARVYPDSRVVSCEAEGSRTGTFAQVGRSRRAARRRADPAGRGAGRPGRHVRLEQPGAPRGLLRHPVHGRGPAHPQHAARSRAARATSSTTPRTASIIVDGSLIPLLASVAGQAEDGRALHRGRRRRRVRPRRRPSCDYEELLAAEAPGFAWPELDERAAAAMCYTTGTTGDPKGVVYSHRSTFLHSLACCRRASPAQRGRPGAGHRADVPRQRLGHALRRASCPAPTC